MKNKIGILVISSGLLGSLLFSSIAFAQTPSGGGAWGGKTRHSPGVFGTVSSITGSTLTIASKGFGKNPTATTYTVDATSATVNKNGSTSTLATISVGDTVMVVGAVSGSNVTATAIRDGVGMMGGKGMGMGMRGGHSTSTPPIIQGNGRPIIGGSVSAITGSTLTVTNKSNVTYTVDATSATIQKGNVATALTSIAVGDNVVVQGTVNGTSITASSIMDSGVPPAATATDGTANSRRGPPGFLGVVGGFFQHLFGFF